jgi:adenosine kinase
MSILICGSLAFDTISVFQGRFAQQILPEQLHILNVSFFTPELRREFGGCAGNIAYSLNQLGGKALIMATLGADGADYKARFESWGLNTAHVQIAPESYTAQAFIITDADNNQITAFHPGAMQLAHQFELPKDNDIRLAIISPNGREAMLTQAEQLAKRQIPFVFDPGQQLPMFDAVELKRFLSLATWVTVNDYEARLLCERTGQSLQELSKTHLRAVIVTLGEKGCEWWQDGVRQALEGLAAEQVLDPTGCGDAFRAGLLYGLERDWPMEKCAQLGNRLGALKIAHRGGQNHKVQRMEGS